MATSDDEGYDSEYLTVSDVVRRWWYTLMPQQYTDEDSDVTELLWQQILEQRALRHWLIVLCVLIAVLGSILVLTIVL